MKLTVFIPDIECDSCVKLLQKRFSKIQGIEDYKIRADSVDFTYDESLVKPANIISVIKSAGFRASTNPFERKTLKERVRHFKEKKDNYEIEITALKYALYSFLLLTIIELVAYNGLWAGTPGFIAKYGWWLLYLNISVASLTAAVWNVYAYETKVTCMVGMMIGMTIGMQSGMMLGAIMGATNGFFVGAMSGMLIGVIVGWITGQCCGVMGIMEGMMAGLMGGTMGPMITVMMFSDHVLWFMPFYILINLFILGGLSYMILEEVVEGKEGVRKRPADFATFASAAVIIGAILIAIMIYGPKSGLVSFI